MKRHAIYTGIGKTEVELRRIAEEVSGRGWRKPAKASLGDPGIIYVITREEIEALDLKRFLANFGPRVSVKRLRQIAGRISFTVHGYEDREEEIFEIPEVREYFRIAHKRWPCWLFTADVRTACFHSVILSVLPNLNIMRVPATGINQAQTSFKDLETFFKESLVASALMEAKAGISMDTVEKRIEALMAYVGL